MKIWLEGVFEKEQRTKNKVLSLKSKVPFTLLYQIEGVKGFLMLIGFLHGARTQTKIYDNYFSKIKKLDELS